MNLQPISACLEHLSKRRWQIVAKQMLLNVRICWFYTMNVVNTSYDLLFLLMFQVS